MKKKLTITYHFLLFFLCVALAICGLLLGIKKHYLPVSFTASISEETKEALNNPYCGFFTLAGYLPSEDKTAENAYNWGTNLCSSTKNQLILLEINLMNYRQNTWLSGNACGQINRVLDACADSKKQVILRFVYDWDGNAKETEPDSRTYLENHMKQLAAYVNSHKSSIYLLQGIFTGNCGEMNNTRYGSEEDITALMETLADQTDPSIFLSVRTPQQLRMILKTKQPVTSTEAYGNTLAARLGLYNDGMLGSVYDLGTYDDTPFSTSYDYTEKGTREEEINYQDHLCQYVPNGGEVTVDNSYNDLDNAISDLSAMHVSFLNDEHDLAVLDKWKASVYHGSDVFDGQSGYDYVKAHLGYRYVAADTSLSFHPLFDDQALLYVTIRNTGFAPAYRLFDTTLFLTNTDTGEKKEVETTIDNRTIPGNDASIFTLSLDVRALAAGTYTVSLSMADPASGLPVFFANAGSTDEAAVILGTLSIP